jgi:hypothetical protein
MMRRAVSTIAGLAIFINTIFAGVPGLPNVAKAEDVSAASWPHTIATDEATVVLYPPQATTWKEYRSLEARVAVEVTKQTAKKPVLGTLEVTVDTHTDFDTRTVVASHRQVRSSRFPSLGTEQAAAMEQLVQWAMTNEPCRARAARYRAPEPQGEGTGRERSRPQAGPAHCRGRG